VAASVAFNTLTKAFQQYEQRSNSSNSIKKYVRRRSKSVIKATILVAAVAAVTMITRTIKIAMIAKVYDLLSSVTCPSHLAIQLRGGAFNNFIIAILCQTVYLSITLNNLV
jgi:hypothetical protein